MRLDLDLPQNAACAEYVAVILAAEHTSDGQIVHVVSDSAVVTRSFGDVTFEGTHKVMYSGMWRSFPLIRERIRIITKLKSHMDRELAVKLGVL